MKYSCVTKYLKHLLVICLLGAGAVYGAATWHGTDWIADGNLISAQKTKDNFDYLYSRALPECGDGELAGVIDGEWSCQEASTYVTHTTEDVLPDDCNLGQVVAKGSSSWECADVGSPEVNYELIASHNATGVSRTGTIFSLSAGKKFSDYDYVVFVATEGSHPTVPHEFGGSVMVPASLFVGAPSDISWTFQTFSGDDSGSHAFWYQSDTSFTYARYRAINRGIKVYGISN